MRVNVFSVLTSVLCIGLFGIGAFGQQAATPPIAMPNTTATATQNYPVQSGDYVIGGGDEIEVKVFKNSDITGKYRVSETGYVDFFLIGRQRLGGLSESEATDFLRQQLRKYYKQPEVTVTVTGFNSQLITVIGAVKAPGRLPLKRSMRVLDVVALSGGLLEESGRFVHLIRYSQKPDETNNGTVVPAAPVAPESQEIDVQTINVDEIIAGNSSNNILLKPGDIVSVPKADVVYVAGNVRKSGAVTVRNPTTVRQAIALSNGFADGAKYNDMRLYRTIPGKIEREEIKISWKDIQNGKQKDLFLQANDVLYVPNSELKSIGQTFLRGLPQLVTGALLPILLAR